MVYIIKISLKSLLRHGNISRVYHLKCGRCVSVAASLWRTVIEAAGATCTADDVFIQIHLYETF